VCAHECRLVLPEEKKVLIRSLVENSADFSDIISGKGGGCIFLLHGSPGVGKTLTAESVAELLHRPLYSVSVGELGTDTNELEKKLTEILEVSSSWNAVILLDEADVCTCHVMSCVRCVRCVAFTHVCVCVVCVV
jgi:SpoVK/Ycf46/Vps4 family AAA+-type ATPase